MGAEVRFVHLLSIAFSNASLYSLEHEMVDRAVGKALSLLAEIPGGALEIMVVEGDLVLNKVRQKDVDVHGRGIVKRFGRRGFSWVHFKEGLAPAELKRFIGDVVDPDGKPGQYPHIALGAIGVRTGGTAGGGVGADLSAFSREQIERLKEIYSTISPFKKLQVTGLEEIVAGFVVAIRQEARVLKMISPVKSYSEYTYTHATNVALLSMALASSLGVRDEVMHEIGVAALMHDIGKQFISKEVLHKKGKLEEHEFKEMMQHPVFGAHYLAGMEELTHLAALAAFEHHRKFDGSGYPKLKVGQKRQHICSQVVAVADFFDALRSNRPYREGWEPLQILSLMKENVGRDFNPFLLANFEIILKRSLELEPEEKEAAGKEGGAGK